MLNTQQRVGQHNNCRIKCNIEKGCFILCLFFLLQHKYFSCKKISQTWQLGQQVSRLSPVSNVSPSPVPTLADFELTSMLSRLLRKKTYHQHNETKWSEHQEQWCSWEIKHNQVFVFKVKSIMRQKFILVYLPHTGTHYVAYYLCFN